MDSKLKLISQLHLSPQDKCMYYLTAAQLKYRQFMEKIPNHQLQMFEESVVSIPWAESGERKLNMGKLETIFLQIQGFVQEALTVNLSIGDPQDCRVLVNIFLNMECYKIFNYSTNVPKTTLKDLLFYLEYPKSMFLKCQKNDEQYQGAANISDFVSDYLEKIPDDLIICSLSIDPERNFLTISRQTKEGQLLVRLPMLRSSDVSLSYFSAKNELDEILDKNNATTSEAKNCTTNITKRKWLKERQELDLNLKELLNKIQLYWLGGFKGIFGMEKYDRDSSIFKRFKEKVERLVFSHVIQRSAAKSMQLSFDPMVIEMILGLGPDPDYDLAEDMLGYLADSYQSQGTTIAHNELDFDHMAQELDKALFEFYRSFKPNNSNHSVCIITDKFSQTIPWESMECLRGKPVSRMPSYNLVQERMSMPRAKFEKGFYMLNPGGDLVRTQSKFENELKRPGYCGIVNREPDEDLTQELGGCDVFLYFGHGGAEKYINSNTLNKLAKAPSALLFGCSSGRLRENGDFDPHGIALDYLLASSPMVLGNMWDVTDVDTDRFTKALLDAWFQGQNLVHSANIARDSCQLSYLVGAAPVVYGVYR